MYRQQGNQVKHIRGYCLSVSLFIASFIYGQKTEWINEPFSSRYFIENKGQFDKDAQSASSVYFGIQENNTKIFFSGEGLIFRTDSTSLSKKLFEEFMEEEMKHNKEKDEKETEREEALKRSMYSTHTASVKMQWLNSNSSVVISPSDMMPEYFTYSLEDGRTIGHANAFKKLVYKNIYPNIDLIYTIPEKEGIKYSFIIHPGADVSDIQMQYSGNITGLQIDKNGNLSILTPLGKFTDHAPLTFYEEDNNPVHSSFEINGNIVSFKLGEYDNSKKIIIDPWTTVPAFATQNKAYEIAMDASGNTYIYGSHSPFKVRKFDNAGVGQWTYNSPWGAAWLWGGDLAADNAGNTYITSAVSDGRVIKINTAGVPQYAVIHGAAGTYEEFRLQFDRPRTTLYTTATFFTKSLMEINTATGAASTIRNYGANNEIRSLTLGLDGNYYGLTVATCCWPSLNGSGTVLKIRSTLAPPSLWDVNNGYPGGPDYPYMGPAYSTHSAGGTAPGGTNGIAASFCYVYTYNGDTLMKRNNTNGALIAKRKVAGGLPILNSGILVDSCDYIYVGTQNGISKYDKNLNFVTSIPLPRAVYDMCFDANMDIVACGDSMVISTTSLWQPCPAATMSITAIANNDTCSSQRGSAGVTNITGGTPPYTYTWNTASTTAAITGLAAGSYTVIVKDASCIPLQDTVSLTLGNTVLPTVVNILPPVFSCDSTQVSGTWYFSSQTLRDTIWGGSYTGCDSIVNTPLVIYNSFLTNMATLTSCDSGFVQGAWYYTSQTVSNTYSSINGCDSIIKTPLVINQSAITNTSVSSCDSSFINGKWFYSTQTVRDTIPGATASGCDSITITQLTINQSINNQQLLTLCQGQSAVIHGISQNTAGVYTQTYTTASGCDSISSVTLTLNTVTQNSITASACSNYTHNGQTYTGSGVYTQTLTGSSGCDSILTIQLTVGNVATGNQILQACDSVLFQNKWYYTSQTINDTITGGSSLGCDSITITQIAINQPSNHQITASACNSYTHNGQTYTGSGVYTQTLTNAAGCDSVLTINLTINSSMSTSRSDSICPGQSLIIHGINQSAPGTYTQTYTAANGCDSVSSVTLVIYPQPIANFSAQPQPTTIFNPVILFTDQSQNANNWLWSFGDVTSSFSTIQHPTYTYGDTGTFQVTLIVKNNYGCYDTITKNVIITEDYVIYIPNTFTPNEDGLNDIFLPKGLGLDPEQFEFYIFDRWGNMIFESTDMAKGWDGRANGGVEIAQQDTYVWLIRLKDKEGVKHRYVGHVNLVK